MTVIRLVWRDALIVTAELATITAAILTVCRRMRCTTPSFTAVDTAETRQQ